MKTNFGPAMVSSAKQRVYQEGRRHKERAIRWVVGKIENYAGPTPQLICEQNLRSLLRSMDDLVFTVSLGGVIDGYHETANSEMLYAAPEEFLGEHVRDVFPPETAEILYAAIKMVAETGNISKVDYSLVVGNNEKRWFNAVISPIKDQSGKPRSLTVVVRDVTESAQSKLKYKDLFQNAPVGFHNISPKGIILDVNNKWLEVLGHKRQEVIGKSIFDFVVPEQRENARIRFEERLEHGKPQTSNDGDRLYLRKDGTKVPVLTHDTVIRNEKGDVHIVQTSFENLTDLRQAQQDKTRSELQQREMEAAVLAINGLVHALSQKFTVLLGYVGLLQRSPEKKEYSEALNKAMDEIATYFSMFDFFRFGIGRGEAINLTTFAENIFKKAGDKFSNFQIQTELYIAEDLGKIKTSSAALAVILEAVLTNAFEAVGMSGRVALLLRKTWLEENPALEILVTDDGKGIEPEVQDKMFRPFYSTDPDATALQKGLSLGLARFAVDRLGGKIEVKSVPGQGTEFKILLPLEVEES
ncbi:MAG: PAS domain S-box protein [Candidatus Margulisiibacteriota bacterium]